MNSTRHQLAVELLALVTVASGCGTFVYGSTEQIPIVSDPPGAAVTVDANSVGDTPLTVTLSRKNEHKIRVEKSGYIPYETTTETTPNTRALWIDYIPSTILPPLLILFGFGDYGTGATYKIVPDRVDAHLVAAASASSTSSNAQPVRNAAAAATAISPSATATPPATSTLATQP